MNLGYFQSGFARPQRAPIKERKRPVSETARERESSLPAHLRMKPKARQASTSAPRRKTLPDFGKSKSWNRSVPGTTSPELPEQQEELSKKKETTQPRRINFRHFQPLQKGQRVRRKGPSNPNEAAKSDVQKLEQQARVRSDLDVGLQHLLQGNAPVVLSLATSTTGRTKKKVKDPSERLLKRFVPEDETELSALGTPYTSSGARLLRSRWRTRDGEDLADPGHSGRDSQGDFQWSSAFQSVEEMGPVVALLPSHNAALPEYIPQAGRSRYQNSGVELAASFLGLTVGAGGEAL